MRLFNPRQYSLFLLVPLLAACYVAVPVDVATVRPGTDVRVLVAPPAGTERVAGVTELRGEFMRLTSDSLTIGTRLDVQSYAGPTIETLRQPVTLARSGVVQVTVPELHRPRTFGIIGGVAVLAVVILTDVLGIRGDGNTRPNPPPPDNSPLTGWRPW